MYSLVRLESMTSGIISAFYSIFQAFQPFLDYSDISELLNKIILTTIFQWLRMQSDDSVSVYLLYYERLIVFIKKENKLSFSSFPLL